MESLEAQRTEGGGEGQAAEIGETGGNGHFVSPAGRDVAGRGADAAKREVDERCETQSYSEGTRGQVVGEPLAHSARKLPERHFGPNSGAKRKHGNEEPTSSSTGGERCLRRFTALPKTTLVAR